jgi:hypothetical protein
VHPRGVAAGAATAATVLEMLRARANGITFTNFFNCIWLFSLCIFLWVTGLKLPSCHQSGA